MNNYERGVTSVYSFDMIGKKVDLRKITHNNAASMDKYTFDYTDNSMLFEDKLYFVSAESGKLNIQIRDFHSGSLLHEYNTARNDEIDYKNTPIIQQGSFYKSGPPRIGKDPSAPQQNDQRIFRHDRQSRRQWPHRPYRRRLGKDEVRRRLWSRFRRRQHRRRYVVFRLYRRILP